MSSRLQTNRGTQWSFVRFLVGCICSYTSYVGGCFFALNVFVGMVFAILIGVAAHAMGVANKMLLTGICLSAMMIGLFCLWGALRVFVGKLAFPKCKSGCCSGKNDYSYRFGTWLGLTGWRKWMFVCSCGHLYEVHCGRWRYVDDLAADDTGNLQSPSKPRISSGTASSGFVMSAK